MKPLWHSIGLSLLIGSTLWAQTTPEKAEIRGVQVQGSGCEDTTASVSISPDLKDLSVLFDNYSVEIGNGSSQPGAVTAQKNCLVTMDIYAPRGWQYAFKSVDYRGFVSLPASAWGFHRFSSMSATSIVPSLKEVTHKGPLNNDYTFHVEGRPERLAWSECIQGVSKVKLLSQLAVSYYPRTSDRSNAQISLDSQDNSLRQDLGVVWRRCSPNSRPTPPGANLPPGGPVRPRYF